MNRELKKEAATVGQQTVPSEGTVVVTGLGMTTPIGGDVPTTWAAMLAGTPGARALTGAFAVAHGLSVSVALLVKDRDAGTSARVALEGALR